MTGFPRCQVSGGGGGGGGGDTTPFWESPAGPGCREKDVQGIPGTKGAGRKKYRMHNVPKNQSHLCKSNLAYFSNHCKV